MKTQFYLYYHNYYDIENNNLLQCNSSDYLYYHNSTNNKKTCFKKEFGCPSSYPYFNETTNECYNNDSSNIETISETSKIYTENAVNNSYHSNYDNTEEFDFSSSQMKQINNSCLECDYNCYKIGNCSFDNYNTSEDVYNIIKSKFISEYDGTEGSLKVSNGNNFVYQITTVNNELDSLLRNIKSDLSVINLKECADLLKKQNGVDPDTDLVILKYENEDSVSNGDEKYPI